jgi:50S ribosomal subunit-associated GTPase HflX
VLAEYPVRSVVALNKIDLVDEKEVQKKLELLNSFSSNVVPISALKKSNLGTLVDLILANT